MNVDLNYPVGKRRLAPWIVKNMPDHHSYLEPFFGCGAVLFEKSPARIETVNDIDGEIVNFFRVVQCPEKREKLCEAVSFTPYAREIYESVFKREPEDDIERALWFAVRSMQSHGFRITEKSGWKKDVYGREAAYAVRYWNRLPDSLQFIGRRLKSVQIENRPAVEVIAAFDHENVLIYCDPPYVLSTRSRKQYRYEMTDNDHKELLQVINKSQAKIMISGYDCELYDRYLHNWRKEQMISRTQSLKQRTEILWMNY